MSFEVSQYLKYLRNTCCSCCPYPALNIAKGLVETHSQSLCSCLDIVLTQNELFTQSPEKCPLLLALKSLNRDTFIYAKEHKLV